MRNLPAAALLAFGIALACSPARAQDTALPDIGSSAGEVIDPATEAEYGEYVLYELRRMGLVLDDPLIDSWMHGMGYRLAASSSTPQQKFTFFMLRQRDINAFATLGGVVGMNSGLVLTAENEAEVAGVVAHEIAHVSQRHVLRAVERARKDQIPILLGMLGAIAASQALSNEDDNDRDGHNDDSGSNATAAAVAGAMALMQQRQIDYTRANESEADRIGIQTLARAGYDPAGMADFFERMQRAQRGNSGGYQMPEYLRTHPVTTTRISEARQRAQQLQATGSAAAVHAPANPLLPGNLRYEPAAAVADSEEFAWVRERLRVLSADSPIEAVREYRALERRPDGARRTDAERYGLALALMRSGGGAEAETLLGDLLTRHPEHLWLLLAQAESAALAGHAADADERYGRLLRTWPENRAVRLSYAQALAERGNAEAGRRAQEVLRPLLADSARDPLFQRSFGRASELAGDLVRAGEAFAEAAYLNGRAVDALNQLDALKARDDLTYYQRARIEARIAAITPVVLEMDRQGIGAHEQRPDTQ